MNLQSGATLPGETAMRIYVPLQTCAWAWPAHAQVSNHLLTLDSG